MKKKLVFCSFFAVFAFAVYAQQMTVAVRSFETSGGLSSDEGSAITDLFISELVSGGKIKVVDRNSFDAILAEMKFQLSDWSDDSKVAALGKALNAGSIIQGTVTSLGGQIIITVRVLDINTAHFISSSTLRIKSMNEIFDKFPLFVKDLVQNLPGAPVYHVGGNGPAGGLIFYDKGSYSNGWRYLEAAPASAEFIDSYKSAVERCAAMNVNGLTGWRLPSSDELLIIYNTLKQKGLGDFKEDKSYKSSTYYNNIRQMGGGWTSGSDGYYSVNFKGGYKNDGWGQEYVRAVRAF